MIAIPRISLLFLFGIALLIAACPAIANEKPVGLWIMEFKKEAQAQGISPALLEKAFHGFAPDERVVSLDRKQPEGTKTFHQYLESAASPARVKQGRELYLKHKALLERIGKKYGVQPRFIVALWGIETNYGQNTGGFSVVRSLATLAYEGRRADFFRDELLKALKIIQAGHITLEQMQGSWAGAMGQSQFMPSSFLSFAVDENKNGRKDIWNTQEDVFASIANYLHKSGWNDSLTWGRRVRLPEGFDISLENIDKMRPLDEWRALGIKNVDGTALPARNVAAALVFPNREPSQGAWLVYPNFHVLLKWNRSRYFASAVGILADRIEGK